LVSRVYGISRGAGILVYNISPLLRFTIRNPLVLFQLSNINIVGRWLEYVLINSRFCIWFSVSCGTHSSFEGAEVLWLAGLRGLLSVFSPSRIPEFRTTVDRTRVSHALNTTFPTLRRQGPPRSTMWDLLMREALHQGSEERLVAGGVRSRPLKSTASNATFFNPAIRAMQGTHTRDSCKRLMLCWGPRYVESNCEAWS
jgi:hypothetical protein